jgi:hypothetical protein
LPALDRKIQDARSDWTSFEAFKYTIYMENFASIVREALARAGDRQRGEPLLGRALEWHDVNSGSKCSFRDPHRSFLALLARGETDAALDAFSALLNMPDRMNYGNFQLRFIM